MTEKLCCTRYEQRLDLLKTEQIVHLITISTKSRSRDTKNAEDELVGSNWKLHNNSLHILEDQDANNKNYK